VVERVTDAGSRFILELPAVMPSGVTQQHSVSG
jgi:hypothetical protein